MHTLCNYFPPTFTFYFLVCAKIAGLLVLLLSLKRGKTGAFLHVYRPSLILQCDMTVPLMECTYSVSDLP